MATLPASTHLLEISWAPADDRLDTGEYYSGGIYNISHSWNYQILHQKFLYIYYIGGAVSGRQGEVSILGIINPTSDTGAVFTGAGPARPRAQPSRTLVH